MPQGSDTVNKDAPPTDAVQPDRVEEQMSKEQVQSRQFLNGLSDILSGWAQKEDTDVPDIFHVILQAMGSMERKIALTQIRGVDVVISPDIAHIDTLEFHRGNDAMARGYAAAKKVISKRRVLRRLT